MSPSPTPLQIAQKLTDDAERVENPAIQQDIQEGAETLIYLLTLLRECAAYIEDIKEYDVPPRFLKAVREVLK